MKTLSTLTAAFLIIVSFHASANENKGKTNFNTPSPIVTSPEDVNPNEIEELKITTTVRLPNIPELNQEDLNVKEIEGLKSSITFRLPNIPALNQEDVNANEIEELKSIITFRLPNIPVLDHADLDIKEIEQLKVQAPEMVWGSSSDVDTVGLELLKTTDVQEREF